MKSFRLLILSGLLISCEHREFSNPNDPINLPKPPELLEPTGEMVSSDNPPIFKWKSEEESGLEFELQVSEDRDFKRIAKDKEISSSDYRPYGSPFRGGKHFWRVRARNAGGTIYSEWSEPDSFSVKFPLIGRYFFSSHPTQLEIYKGYGYITISGRLEILNLKDPDNPQFVREIKNCGCPISIRDEYLYSTYTSHLKIYSLSEPTSPESLSCLILHFPPYRLLVSDRYVYIGSQYEVGIIDILKPTNPRYLSTYQASAFIKDIAVKGDTLFIALGDKIELVDVKVPENPTKIGEIDTPASYLYLSGNLLYCVGYETIYILDVSSSPLKRAGEIRLLADGKKIIVKEGKIFVWTKERGGEEIDIWDAENLKRLGSFGYYRELQNLNIQDGYLYLLGELFLFIGRIE